MEPQSNDLVMCQICRQTKPLRDTVDAHEVRPMLVEQAHRARGAWDPEGYVCLEDLDHLRIDYVREALETGKQEFVFEGGGGFSSSPAVAGGKLIIANDRGVLFCLGEKTGS